jgi:phenylacetic acid degradation operon negative regulatory protein
MDGPSPRSLILDLLSTLRPGHTMPVGLLVEAGGLFEIAGGTLRVALARLLASGRVERDERGAYRLSAAAAPVQQTIARWRARETTPEPWDGGWWAVLEGPRPRGAAARHHDQALRLHGLAPLEPRLWIRPANLAGGCDALRESLEDIGLAEGSRVFAASDFDAQTEARARALWNVDALHEGYRKGLESLAASEARLPVLERDAAMCESFLVGGRVLQQLVLDPKLPAAILDPTPREALTQAMRRYDRAGREAWAALLARYDVPHRQTPADAGYDTRVDRVVAA